MGPAVSPRHPFNCVLRATFAEPLTAVLESLRSYRNQRFLVRVYFDQDQEVAGEITADSSEVEARLQQFADSGATVSDADPDHLRARTAGHVLRTLLCERSLLQEPIAFSYSGGGVFQFSRALDVDEQDHVLVDVLLADYSVAFLRTLGTLTSHERLEAQGDRG
jgi:hypothetical protein